MPNGPYSVFDGYSLTLYRADGSVAGSWAAISGVTGHQRPSDQNLRDVGPLPTGNYSFALSDIQVLDQRNQWAGFLGRGEWPGGMASFGTQRAFLLPDADTNVLGRSDFSIHGGFWPGSRGCIDLGPNEEVYFATLRSLGGSSHQLIVQYNPTLEANPHPLTTNKWFDGVSGYVNRTIPGLLDRWFPAGTQLNTNGNSGTLQYTDGSKDAFQFGITPAGVDAWKVSTTNPAGTQITDATITANGIVISSNGSAAGQLWSQRWVDIDTSFNVLADIRDYTSISNQWLANHAFPTTNLWQADENLATELSASVTRDAMHGGAIDYSAPNPIAYERQEDIFRLGSYDIDRHLSLSGIASVRLTDPSGLGSSFDISGSYFNGPRDFGIRVAFTPPVSLFDSMFNNMFGGLPPVVLDLDGDGVRIEPRTGSNVFFNADGDSAIERTSWVGSGDGLLAIDPDGDGKITKADEIAFANLTADPNDTDLEALATLYDANGDHKLDAADGVWGQLRVWVDGNRNAVTDGGELKTLAQQGITSISLISDRNTFTLPDGSRINGFGSFVRNGATHTLADTTLSFESNGFTKTTQQEVTTYTSQDGATVKTYYDTANLPSYNDSPGVSINVPGNYVHEGVLGGAKRDVVDIRNATKSLILYGGADADDLRSGAGNDVLDGGAGIDELRSGAGDDTVYFDSTDTVVNGGPGYDTGILTFSLGNYFIRLSDKGLESFISSAGNDIIWADTTNTVVYIDGRGGGDTIHGGNYGDMLTGGTGNDELHGNAGNDLLVGGADHDKLYGDAGEDVLIGGIGSDTIDGGSDADTATFTGAAADYTMAAYNGHIYVRAANGDRDDVTGVEFLRFDDRTIDPNSVQQLGAINPLEYVASYSDLIAGIGVNSTAALNHYVGLGFFEGRSVSFDGLAYLASHADLINAYRNDATDTRGAIHFITNGHAEGRGITFKPASYLALHADLQAAFGNDLDAAARHYIQTGYFEGRPWDRAPVFTSAATLAVSETRSAVTTVTAADPDAGDSVTYAIVAGADAARFGINATSGALAFAARPDFENPADADHNNSYVVTVRASDGVLSADQTITVNVTDIQQFSAPALSLADFAPANGWGSDDLYPRHMADVNGDGMADIVGFSSSGVLVSLATGGGSFAAAALKLAAFHPDSGWTSDTAFPRHLADVNGDGMADIVAFGSPGVIVSLATGGGSFAAPVVKLAQFHPNNGWASDDAYPRRLADVNGDGMADIVGFGGPGVIVSLATGGGSFAAPVVKLAQFHGDNGWTSDNAYPRHLADVNGDNMADIVGFGGAGVIVSLATGGGSFATPAMKLAAFTGSGWSSDNTYPRELADVNGDGMADIVGFGIPGVFVSLATGGGSFTAPGLELSAYTGNGWTSDNAYPRHLADIDNDYAADLIGFGQNGVYTSLAHAYMLV